MEISQAEARRLRRRVRELEALQRRQRSHWQQDWPEGTVLGSLDNQKGGIWWAVNTARRLNHAVVVTQRDDGRLVFHALPVAQP